MKKLVFLASVALLAAGCSSQTAYNSSGTPTPPVTQTVPAAPAATPPAQPTTNGTAVGATDDSNAYLNADLNNVDTQMGGLNSDSASVDESMTEQQAPSAQ